MNAGLPGGDNIHVPLKQYGLPLSPDRPAGPVKVEQLPTLVKKRRFRAVQVFGVTLSEHAPAEGDHPALGVMDGKHHASAEAVKKSSG